MKPAIKIAIIYAILGTLWILLSDEFLLLFLTEKDVMSLNYLQTIKGVFYVTMTALLLYFLVNRYYKSLNEKIRRLEFLNRQLENSNRELEQYAYVASHDLQEPLRVVSNLLQRLKMKHTDQLDEKGTRYIDLAVENAGRMRLFVLDLLEFARVGKSNEPVSKTNVNEVLTEVKGDLQASITESGARISYPDLPVIYVQRMLFRQVLSNLISNSIKYRRPGVEPVITVSCNRAQNHWCFVIDDNGIGIEEEYFDKIFELFQRLHGDDVYSGTGIGLAISKKIIEHWGGRIWLDSSPGKGSSFYFTVPATAVQPD
jgi:light-regulated signal transduction histidine kinase (bacteriophytochrome)